MALRVIEGIGTVVAADFGGTGSEPGDTTWNQLAVVGKWDGHWQGPFEISAKDISQLEQSISASRVEIPIDYGHATLYDREAPAAGWVKSAQTRDVSGQPVLFGQLKWNARAAAAIRGGEYRYLSPTIQWRSIDRVSGKMGGTSLHSVALTNKPFLHELPAVQLTSIRAAMRQLEEESPMNEEQRKKMALALGLSEDATVEQIEAKIAALASSDREAAALLTSLGVKTYADATRTVLTLRADSTRKPEITELESLRVENERLKAGEVTRSALAAITKAQEERKVKGGSIDPKTGEPTADSTENFKANWAFVKRDPAGFSSYVATLEPIGPVTFEHAASSTPVTMSDGKPGTPVFLALYARKLTAIKSSPDRLEVIRLMGSTPEATAQIEAENEI
jgi:phage I-like protein